MTSLFPKDNCECCNVTLIDDTMRLCHECLNKITLIDEKTKDGIGLFPFLEKFSEMVDMTKRECWLCRGLNEPGKYICLSCGTVIEYSKRMVILSRNDVSFEHIVPDPIMLTGKNYEAKSRTIIEKSIKNINDLLPVRVRHKKLKNEFLLTKVTGPNIDSTTTKKTDRTTMKLFLFEQINGKDHTYTSPYGLCQAHKVSGNAYTELTVFNRTRGMWYPFGAVFPKFIRDFEQVFTDFVPHTKETL